MVDNLYRSHGLFHTLPIIFPVIVSSESVFYEEMTYKVYCTAIRLLFDKEFQFFFQKHEGSESSDVAVTFRG